MGGLHVRPYGNDKPDSDHGEPRTAGKKHGHGNPASAAADNRHVKRRGRAAGRVAAGVPGESTLDSLERVLGLRLAGGRQVWFGLPVDVDAIASTNEHVVVKAVDEAATRDLLKELRGRGFGARYHCRSDDVAVTGAARR